MMENYSFVGRAYKLDVLEELPADRIKPVRQGFRVTSSLAPVDRSVITEDAEVAFPEELESTTIEEGEEGMEEQ